jgi:RimJ/RimL family protein N-acetyltransferase
MTADNQNGGFDPEAAKAPIVTRRLLLRAPEIGDIPALARIINDPVIARYNTGVPFPYAPIEGWRFMRSLQKGQGNSANFFLALRDNPGHIVGGAGFRWYRNAPPDLGYWIAADFRRRGYAGEATRAMLQRIFTLGPDVTEVHALVRDGNAPSQRVLRRAGFARHGMGLSYSRSERRYLPMIRFVLKRATWEQRRGASAQP